MRPYFTERREALAALACARLSAGGAPPVDWIAAAVECGRLLHTPPRDRSKNRVRRLRRLGLLSERGG